MEPLFDHEKLKVYQKAIEFVSWSTDLLEEIPKTSAVYDQLDRSSTSMPLNIAEGNGKRHPKDRCRFFDIAYGSGLEAASALDVMVARRYRPTERVYEGKVMLAGFVRMMIGLIKSNDPDREFGAG